MRPTQPLIKTAFWMKSSLLIVVSNRGATFPKWDGGDNQKSKSENSWAERTVYQVRQELGLQAKPSEGSPHCFPSAGSAAPRPAGLSTQSGSVGAQMSSLLMSPLPPPWHQLPCGVGHPSGQFGHAVLVVYPSRSRCTPSLLGGRAVPGAEGSWADM